MYGILIKIDLILFIKYYVLLLFFVVCISMWYVVFFKYLIEDVFGNVGFCIFCIMKNYKNIIFFILIKYVLKKVV